MLDSFVTTNSTLIYDSIKQGNDFADAVNADEFYSALIDFCTLDERSGTLFKFDSNGNENYSMTAPFITCRYSSTAIICISLLPISVSAYTVPFSYLNSSISPVSEERLVI